MAGYGMVQQTRIANKATNNIVEFLMSIPTMVGVINVEDDDFYREKDVDLVAVSNKSGETKSMLIEIKGDTYHHTGNYFFETISNKELGTEGCFLYTEADFLFYYYVNKRELHMLPMKETREWFLDNQPMFPVKETQTAVAGDYYTTVGNLVPRHKLLEEVEGVKVFNI